MHISKKWFSAWCLSCSGDSLCEHLLEDCCPIKAKMMDDRDNWLAMTTLTMQGHISISQLLETEKHGRQSGIIRYTPRMVKSKPKLIYLSYVQLSHVLCLSSSLRYSECPLTFPFCIFLLKDRCQI